MFGLSRTSYKMHGMYRKDDGGLWWYQYWQGVRHVWYVFEIIPVWTRIRRRERPMYYLTRQLS